jgi:SAM-dependent methyltransferase
MSKLYKKYHQSYDELFNYKNYDFECDLILKNILVSKDNCILSLGCGTDKHGFLLRKKINYYKYIGIDINKEMYSNINKDINTNYYSYDIINLPKSFILKNKSTFDVIFAYGGVFNYVSIGNLKKLLDVCKVLLNNNGVLIFDIPYNFENYSNNYIDIQNSNNVIKLSLSSKQNNIGFYQTIFFEKTKTNKIVKIDYDFEKIHLHKLKELDSLGFKFNKYNLKGLTKKPFIYFIYKKSD